MRMTLKPVADGLYQKLQLRSLNGGIEFQLEAFLRYMCSHKLIEWALVHASHKQ